MASRSDVLTSETGSLALDPEISVTTQVKMESVQKSSIWVTAQVKSSPDLAGWGHMKLWTKRTEATAGRVRRSLGRRCVCRSIRRLPQFLGSDSKLRVRAASRFSSPNKPARIASTASLASTMPNALAGRIARPHSAIASVERALESVVSHVPLNAPARSAKCGRSIRTTFASSRATHPFPTRIGDGDYLDHLLFVIHHETRHALSCRRDCPQPGANFVAQAADMGHLRQAAVGLLDGVQFAPRHLVARVFSYQPSKIGQISIHARVPNQSVGRHDLTSEFRLGRGKQIVDPFKPLAFRGR